MPHSAVGINESWSCNDFRDGKVDVVSVTYSGRNATEPGKCSVNLVQL